MAQNTCKLTAIHDVILIGADEAHLEVIKRFKKEKQKIYNLTLIHPKSETIISEYLPTLISQNLSVKNFQIDLGHLCLDSGALFICENILEIDVKGKLITTQNQKLPFDMACISNKMFDEGLDILATISQNIQKSPHHLLFKGEDFLSAEIALALRQRINQSVSIKLVSSTHRWQAAAKKDMKSELIRNHIDLLENDPHPYNQSLSLEKQEPAWYREIKAQAQSYIYSENFFSKKTFSKTLFCKSYINQNYLPAKKGLINFTRASEYFILFENGISEFFTPIHSDNPFGKKVWLWMYLRESLGCCHSDLCVPKPFFNTLFYLIKTFNNITSGNNQTTWSPKKSRGLTSKIQLRTMSKRFQVKATKIKNETFLESGIVVIEHEPSTQTHISSGLKRLENNVCNIDKNMDTSPAASCDGLNIFGNKKTDMTNYQSTNITADAFKIKTPPLFSSESSNLIKSRFSFLKQLIISERTILFECMESVELTQLGAFWGGAFLAKVSCAGFELCGLLPQNYLITLELPSEMEKMLIRKQDLFCQGVNWFFRDQKVSALQCQLKSGYLSRAQMTLQAIYQPNHIGNDEQKCRSENFDIIITKPLGSSILTESYRRFHSSSSDFWNGVKNMLSRDGRIGAILNEFKITRASLIGSEGAVKAVQNLLYPDENVHINLDLLISFPGVLQALKKGLRTQLAEVNKKMFQDQIISSPQRKSLSAELLFCDETAGAWVILAPKSISTVFLRAMQNAGLKYASIVGETIIQPSTSKEIRLD